MGIFEASDKSILGTAQMLVIQKRVTAKACFTSISLAESLMCCQVVTPAATCTVFLRGRAVRDGLMCTRHPTFGALQPVGGHPFSASATFAARMLFHS